VTSTTTDVPPYKDANVKISTRITQWHNKFTVKTRLLFSDLNKNDMKCWPVVVVVILMMATFAMHRCYRIQQRFFRDTACATIEVPLVDDTPWRIPKILHSTYSSWEKAQELFGEAMGESRANNVSFEHRFYDDAAMVTFMKRQPRRVYEAFRKINPVYKAAQADLFRYCLINEYGGVYTDIKCIVGDLRRAIAPSDGMLLSIGGTSEIISWTALPLWRHNSHPVYREIQQFWIAARARHPLIQKVIDRTVKAINNYDDAQFKDHNRLGKIFPFLNKGYNAVMATTGPWVYTQAILSGIQQDGERDFRIVCPFLNGAIQYDSHRRNHVRKMGASHYSAQTEPVVLPA